MNKKELKEALEFTKELSIKAGEKLLKFSRKLDRLQLTHKQGIGIATNADTTVENFILKNIKTKYPNHLFMAEESFTGQSVEDLTDSFNSNIYWLIDPLDGTNNFVTGFPYYCTSMALSINGEIKLGVVYRPSNGDLFYAVEGGGAYYQNLLTDKRPKKIKILNNKKKTSDCVFISEILPKNISSRKEGYIRYKNISDNSRGLRRLGSAALDMCYVAHGMFDGYWQSKLFPWDYAGAYVICKESNVRVTSYKGEPFTPLQQSVLVARSPLFDKIIRLMHGNS
jgi:myo-inositol-1(or 4)-monophosphatase